MRTREPIKLNHSSNLVQCLNVETVAVEHIPIVLNDACDLGAGLAEVVCRIVAHCTMQHIESVRRSQIKDWRLKRSQLETV